MNNIQVITIVILSMLGSVQCVKKNLTAEIPVAMLIPKWQVDRGCTKAVMEMAIHDIGEATTFQDSNVKFRIKGFFKEIGSTKRDALNGLNELYRTPPIKIATIGVPYKSQNSFVLDFIYQHKFPYFSYNTADLPARENFNTYVQLSTFIREQFFALAAFMRHFNWKSYSMIIDATETRYNELGEFFKDSVNVTNLTRLTEQEIYSSSHSDNGEAQVEKIHETRSRVNLALVSVKGARKIFCQAYRRKMHKQKIMWILFETLPKNWASDDYNTKNKDGEITREVSCSQSELETAAEGYISLVNGDLRKDEQRTASGMTSGEFRKRLQQSLYNKTSARESMKSCPKNVGILYDSVWMVARLFTIYGDSNHSIFNYTYDSDKNVFDTEYSKRYMKLLDNIDFEGLTGRITFKHRISSHIRVKYKWREGLSDVIINYKEERQVHYGQYNNYTGTLDVFPGTTKVLLGGKKYLKDRISKDRTDKIFNMAIQVTFWVLSGLGLLLVGFVLCSMVALKTIKQCFLNFFCVDIPVIVGCMLCYVCVIIYGIDLRYLNRNNLTISCYGFMACLLFGFTLVFGSLLANIWHVYKKYVASVVIDKDDKIELKHLPEWWLYVILSLLLTADVVFLVVMGTVSPLTTKAVDVSEHFTSTGKKEIEQVVTCSCSHQEKYTIAVYCYKGLLLLFGVFLSWQTKGVNKDRKQQVEVDRHDIAIYNITAISVIGVICVSALRGTNDQAALFAVTALCVIIGATTTLLLVFGRRSVDFIMNMVNGIKKGNKSRSSTQPSSSTSSMSNDSSELKALEKKNSDNPSELSCTTFMTHVPASDTNSTIRSSFNKKGENDIIESDSSLHHTRIYIEQEFTTEDNTSEFDEAETSSTPTPTSTPPTPTSTPPTSPTSPAGDLSSSITASTTSNRTLDNGEGFEQETVNADGILSTSGIYVGDEHLQQNDEILDHNDYYS